MKGKGVSGALRCSLCMKMGMGAVGLFCCDEEDEVSRAGSFFPLLYLSCLWEYTVPMSLQLRDEIIVMVFLIILKQKRVKSWKIR